MIKSAEGSAGLLHKITKPTLWRGGAKRKEWAKHWQCDESVQYVEDKPSGLYKEKEWDATDPPERSLGLDKRNKKGNCRVPGEGGTEWQMAATRVHNDVLLDSEECCESQADCADADVDSWWEAVRAPEVAK